MHRESLLGGVPTIEGCNWVVCYLSNDTFHSCRKGSDRGTYVCIWHASPLFCVFCLFTALYPGRTFVLLFPCFCLRFTHIHQSVQILGVDRLFHQILLGIVPFAKSRLLRRIFTEACRVKTEAACTVNVALSELGPAKFRDFNLLCIPYKVDDLLLDGEGAAELAAHLEDGLEQVHDVVRTGMSLVRLEVLNGAVGVTDLAEGKLERLVAVGGGNFVDAGS
jgi:hypothetical protein